MLVSIAAGVNYLKFLRFLDEMENLPDLERITKWTHTRIKYDSLVHQSIGEGYMTEPELVIAEWMKVYCDLRTPENDNWRVERKMWESHWPEAYQAASKQFDISPEKAEELFKKSLDIRERCIKR